MPIQSRKKSVRFISLFVILIALFLIGLPLGLWQYHQSQIFKNQADVLIKTNNATEAIVFYQKAQQTFPFRWDIAASIAGANLMVQSQKDYSDITDFAEIQTPPPLSNLPITPLGPNEIFVPILMYHHIEINPRPNDPIYAALFVSPTQLDQQLSYLATHDFHPITLDDLSNALTHHTALPPHPIVLSFDDGYQSFYDNAFPLLKKYHMKAVQFVITQVETAPAYLSWDEIVTLDKSGLVEIGAHTRNHPNLPDLSQAAIVDEIKGSKDDLEQHLNHPISWFAYPYGSYSDFIIQVVKDVGFSGAVSTIYGTNQSTDTMYLAPRIMVDGRFSILDLATRIQQQQ